jgi:hypothetical protein
MENNMIKIESILVVIVGAISFATCAVTVMFTISMLLVKAQPVGPWNYLSGLAS